MSSYIIFCQIYLELQLQSYFCSLSTTNQEIDSPCKLFCNVLLVYIMISKAEDVEALQRDLVKLEEWEEKSYTFTIVAVHPAVMGSWEELWPYSAPLVDCLYKLKYVNIQWSAG